MIHKLQETTIEPGNDPQYFPTILGSFFIEEYSIIGVVCTYPERNPKNIYFWLQDVQKYLKEKNNEVTDQRKDIVNKMEVSIFQNDFKIWEMSQIVKQKIQLIHDKWQITSILYNPAKHFSKIVKIQISNELGKEDEDKQFNMKLVSNFQLSGKIFIALSNNKLMAAYCKQRNNETIQYGQIKIQQNHKELNWTISPVDIRKSQNLHPKIIINFRNSFYPFQNYIVSQYQGEFDNDNVQNKEMGFICFQLSKSQCYVNNIKKTQSQIICTAEINERSFAAIISFSGGNRIDIMNCINAETISSIFFQDNFINYATSKLCVNENRVACIVNWNKKSLIHKGIVYSKTEKVSGMKPKAIYKLSGNRFLIICCHLLTIVSMYDIQEDQQFMAM